MAYKLEVNNPDFPKDFEFDCDGILVKNGHTVTVTKEMEAAFASRVGRPIKEIYGHGTLAKLTGSSELSKKEADELIPPEPETVPEPENGGGE